ncbi:glycosyltransferase [Actinotalea subterranea]|uniref:glycosyltransferase n=1 Tax=Actinotalea subterranea TaxID=2607497 RepID=UPI00165D79EB|nr:glycosyltransferase [Actinotalea subterranea]
MASIHIAIVSAGPSVELTRASVRRAGPAIPSATIHVLDVDGSYAPVGQERVLGIADVGWDLRSVHLQAAALEPADLIDELYPSLVGALFEGLTDTDATVLVMRPGVLLLQWPTALLEAAARHGVALVARCASVDSASDDADRWPQPADLALHGAYSPALFALRGPQERFRSLWSRAVTTEGASAGGTTAPGRAPGAGKWLDVAASAVEHAVLREGAALLSAWNLASSSVLEPTPGVEVDGLVLDGRPVDALDLSAWDPTAPWLLDADTPRDPRGRLSDHLALASLVDAVAHDVATDARTTRRGVGPWDLLTTSLGVPLDAAIRALYGDALGDDRSGAPDPFDPHDAEALRTWLTDAAPDGGPGRYLLAIYRTRPDLQQAFPAVPGPGTEGFLAWVRTHGRTEEYPRALVDAALSALPEPAPPAAGRPARGVNVIGYLRGELGIGESARLMVSALRAADVPHATVSVDRHLASRQRPAAEGDRVAPEARFDTSIICVNADLTPSVAASVPDMLARSFRIGMWYWEVEDFPASQHGGFAAVDEVWVATDFVRRAIEPHSPVPVATITPPLPQRGPEPQLTRGDLGLPDRPLFLFSFDYLSTAERKNPLGLLDAFSRAFAPGEGPVLVLKSINADKRPAEAERLRLRAARTPDVLLLEQYLDAAERDALVALCDCYVSLHRSEGLGLTMAEAMAWGKPVIATGYSGNLQFMTPENSFLVPSTPTRIPDGAEPYPAGSVWAEPDLDAAAAFMRTVVDQPEVAAARGARAAADIATIHSPEAAGRRIVARLAETASRRRARSRLTVATRLHRAARQARDSLG